MADQKITQLTALAATPNDADILAIVDDVAGTPITKKITVANLLAGTGGDEIFGTTYFIARLQTLLENKHSSAVTGTGNVTNMSSTCVATGGATTGTGNNARISWGVAGGYLIDGYAKDMTFRCLASFTNPVAGGNVKLYIGNHATPNSMTKYMGIRVNGTTVNFVTKDGTTEELTDITATYGTITNRSVIDFVLTQNSSVKLYVNGVLKATHSTNIPPAADTSSQNYIGIYAENGASAAYSQINLGEVIIKRDF